MSLYVVSRYVVLADIRYRTPFTIANAAGDAQYYSNLRADTGMSTIELPASLWFLFADSQVFQLNIGGFARNNWVAPGRSERLIRMTKS